ncbi:MAG TPA: hypothetical protein VLE49_00070, partial [Anaerolineales bacterium]|nr:hypothetical protein [Anaerolineales bacterium]
MNGYTMNSIRRRIATMLILPFMVVALLACEESAIPPGTGYMETPQPAYAAAQATLDYGQSQMKELSHQATVVGLDMAQAANAAEQATLDYNQRQMMELAYQATAVSLNMAQAAATQQFITEQTQMAWNTTATAQSQAATATYSAYILSVTQTAQAQAILDVQAAQTAQANATQTAYSLTATPFAAIQADIVRTRNVAERRALWGEYVVTPIKVILSTLVVLLLIVGGMIAYRRLMPLLELRLRTIWRENDSPLVLMDGIFVDSDPRNRQSTQRGLGLLKHPRLSSNNAIQVEIIDSSEPSITNWI